MTPSTNQTFKQTITSIPKMTLYWIARGFHGRCATGVACKQMALALSDPVRSTPFPILSGFSGLAKFEHSNVLSSFYSRVSAVLAVPMQRFVDRHWKGKVDTCITLLHSHIFWGFYRSDFISSTKHCGTNNFWSLNF